jgi:hypothetical protein
MCLRLDGEQVISLARQSAQCRESLPSPTGTQNALGVWLLYQGSPMTQVSRKPAIRRRIGLQTGSHTGLQTDLRANLPPDLQPARNADAILDHLESMIRRTAGLGRIASIQGMGLQYWTDRINEVINEINLVSSQKRRANLLLAELHSSDRA